MNDQSIEIVLRGLREAAPGPGMEARIAVALRNAEAGGAPRRVGFGWLPLAGAVAVVVLLGVVRVVHMVRVTEEIVGTSVPPVHRLIPPVVTREAPRQVAGAAKPAGAVTSAVAVTRLPVHAAEARVLEASFPAPPLPLTEQERLLMRLAHANDRQQLAELTQDGRAAQLEREKAEVSAFFPPPAPLVVVVDPPVDTSGGN
jgi:hypothetical protein